MIVGTEVSLFIYLFVEYYGLFPGNQLDRDKIRRFWIKSVRLDINKELKKKSKL